jgi:hypothetical protein
MTWVQLLMNLIAIGNCKTFEGYHATCFVVHSLAHLQVTSHKNNPILSALLILHFITTYLAD